MLPNSSRIGCLLACFGCLSCAGATGASSRGARPAAHAVYGTVRDAVTGAAVAGAIVELTGDNPQALYDTTDQQGRFLIQAPGPGHYALLVRPTEQRPLRTSVTVPERQTVEVRAMLQPAEGTYSGSVRIHEFATSGCAPWSDDQQMTRAGGPMIAWRWRLCDYSDDEYDIRLEFRNLESTTIEFSYRVASVRAPCDNIDAAVDPLSTRLRGEATIRSQERKTHRGPRGLVNKDRWSGYFELCVYEWRRY
jgi:Carboxypeptidase regulatory-like domain